MASEQWYAVAEEGFAVRIPDGWVAEPDPEEGGVDVSRPDGVGMLHLYGFRHAHEDESDPGEELYAFLEDQGIELEEDEVEDFDLAGGAGLALCEYLSEDEEEEAEEDEEPEVTFWLVGVAALPGALVFAHYTCPLGEEEEERETVRRILRSIRYPGTTEAYPGTVSA